MICVFIYGCNIKFPKISEERFISKIVVSVFVGFVLNLVHDLSCLMTGSRFWYFCNNFSVNFSFGGKKNIFDF